MEMLPIFRTVFARVMSNRIHSSSILAAACEVHQSPSYQNQVACLIARLLHVGLG
jgi:hypothetical protein